MEHLGHWVFWAALAACAYMAWNIGANDVANAMGTSVGSHAITLFQALFLAGICEFAGAFLVGGHVTDTIRKGIVDQSFFSGKVDIFIIGMLAALAASGVWCQIATWLGMPVSTTHAIVGSVAGFGLIEGGMRAVYWKSMVSIVASWVISPLAGAVFAYLTFVFIKRSILVVRNPLRAAKKIAPFLIIPVVIVLVLSVIYKGLKNLHLDLPFTSALAIAAVLAAAAAFALRFILRRSFDRRPPRRKEAFTQVETIFKYMQVMTAAYVAFSHGANDVANAVGPFAGIISIVQTRDMEMNLPVPMWVLALGGAGIVLGLATWGYKVIVTLGTRITRITPSRGFSAEFSTATTVLVFSKLGMPISTSHTIVGAVIGVGLAKGLAALNLRVIRDIFSSWIVTIPASALFTMVIFFLLKWVLGL